MKRIILFGIKIEWHYIYQPSAFFIKIISLGIWNILYFDFIKGSEEYSLLDFF